MSTIHNGFARGYMAVQNLLEKTAAALEDASANELSDNMRMALGAGAGSAAGAGLGYGLHRLAVEPFSEKMRRAYPKDGRTIYPSEGVKNKILQAVGDLKYNAKRFAAHNPKALGGAVGLAAVLGGAGLGALNGKYSRKSDELSPQDMGYANADSAVGAALGTAGGAAAGVGAANLYGKGVAPLVDKLIDRANYNSMVGPTEYLGNDLRSRVGQALSNMQNKASTFIAKHPKALARTAIGVPAVALGAGGAYGGHALGEYLGGEIG